ncbi:MAG: sulfite exporter TauE/SafE family protein [Rubrivivax sp.]
MSSTIPLWLPLLIGATFLLAGFVKGVLGMGLPTLAMGLLGLAMPPAQAAALLVLPSFVSNIWQIAGPGFFALLRRLATLLLGLCAGIAAGAGWLTAPGASKLSDLLGLALVAYALLGLSQRRWQVAPRHEAWLSPLVGVLTGLVTAATGVFVIPAVPYLQALGLAKDELVRALGLSFLVATVALAATLGQGWALDLGSAGVSLLALVPTLLGMALGQQLRARLQPEPFRRAFFGGLLLLGAWLALRSLA